MVYFVHLHIYLQFRPACVFAWAPYILTVLVLANAVSCVGLQNKTGHPAYSQRWFQ